MTARKGPRIGEHTRQILLVLTEAGPLNANQLAERVGLTPANTRLYLRRTARRNLVSVDTTCRPALYRALWVCAPLVHLTAPPVTSISNPHPLHSVWTTSKGTA